MLEYRRNKQSCQDDQNDERCQGDVSSSKALTIITIESFGEGLEMRGFDFEIMYVCKSIEVYDNQKPRFNQILSYFSMEYDDVKHGFTKLRLEYSIDQRALEQCEGHRGKHYLSRALFQQVLMSIGSYRHGPCLADKCEVIDHAFCLHCKTWTSPAVQCITRSKNSWPSNRFNTVYKTQCTLCTDRR